MTSIYDQILNDKMSLWICIRVKETQETIQSSFVPLVTSPTPESLCLLREERAKKTKELTRVFWKRNHSATIFSGCYVDDHHETMDPALCSVQITLFISLLAVFLQQIFEFIALGRRHFKELESWFKILILLLALTAMIFEDHLAILNVVSSAAICLSWIEIIFMIGRYPFLGGRFSIMFYAITKRIIQGAISFIIIIIAFGWAFFIISLGSGGQQFENPWKSLLKIIVMVLGEYDFDELYKV